MRYDTDSFFNYREIKAKFNGTDRYNKEIKKGDIIGYNPKNKKVINATAWLKWKIENREADAYEQTGFDCSFDY